MVAIKYYSNFTLLFYSYFLHISFNSMHARFVYMPIIKYECAILLSKLNRYGLKKTVLQWFESYLSCRKQFTQLGVFHSSTEPVPSGVSQGSVLGFHIYNLHQYIGYNHVSSSILMFADRSILIQSSVSVSSLHAITWKVTLKKCRIILSL